MVSTKVLKGKGGVIVGIGYKKIFWGIFIATFNIKLGIIKILPAFVGFLFIVMGLNDIYEETKLESLKGAYNLGILTVAMSFISGVADYFSYSSLYSPIPMSIWRVLYCLIELILFFKILESSIEYLKLRNYQDMATNYIDKLRVYTILSIMNIILMNFALLFNFNKFLLVTSLIRIALRIFMMVITNSLKKLFIGDLLEN